MSPETVDEFRDRFEAIMGDLLYLPETEIMFEGCKLDLQKGHMVILMKKDGGFPIARSVAVISET